MDQRGMIVLMYHHVGGCPESLPEHGNIAAVAYYMSEL
jgi:hypothetical protein